MSSKELTDSNKIKKISQSVKKYGTDPNIDEFGRSTMSKSKRNMSVYQKMRGKLRKKIDTPMSRKNIGTPKYGAGEGFRMQGRPYTRQAIMSPPGTSVPVRSAGIDAAEIASKHGTDIVERMSTMPVERQVGQLAKLPDGGIVKYIHDPSVIGKGTSSLSRKAGEEVLGEIVEKSPSFLSRMTPIAGKVLKKAAPIAGLLMEEELSPGADLYTSRDEKLTERMRILPEEKLAQAANLDPTQMGNLPDENIPMMTQGKPGYNLLNKLTEGINTGPAMAKAPSRGAAEDAAQGLKDNSGKSSSKEGGWMWSMLPVALEALSGANYMGEAAQAGASTLSNFQKRMAQMSALDLKKQELSAKRLESKLKKSKTKGDQEKVLRQELNKESKTDMEIAQQFTKIQNIAKAKQTGANDISLVFAYMKMLDPGSTVREGEQATAKKAGSVPQNIRQMYNRLLGKDSFLDQEVRDNFYKEAKRIYDGQKIRFDDRMLRYKGIADRMGLDSENILIQSMMAPRVGKKAEAPAESVSVRLKANREEQAQLKRDLGIE